MARIEMDVCYESSDEDVMAAAARYGVRATLVERHGPGGGNPLWRFDGAAAWRVRPRAWRTPPRS